jgi:two-component system cell cycle sensor histidine kinase/response regulator CckA
VRITFMPDRTTESARKLRQLAEETIRKEDVSALEALSPEQTQQMLHELRVHQIELEMQNEELRHMQHDLETARQRYFDLYDLAPVGYLTFNKNGLILEANLTAATMLGVVRKVLLQNVMSSFILPEDQDAYSLHRKQLNETGELQAWDMHMVRADGSPFWAHVQATPASNGEYWITLIDITERKQAEMDTAASSKLLQTIINSSPLRIFWKDTALRYLGCNIAFARDAGLTSPDDLIGKDDYQLDWEAVADLYRADDLRVIDTGMQKLAYEELQSTQDGQMKWLRTSKVPLRNEALEIIGVLGIYEDITEFKQAEEENAKLETQLQQAQKMEAVGRLAGGVAHDFNNMLCVIIGYTDMALMETDPANSLNASLTQIRKAAEYSVDLTRQLLAFARKQAIAPQVLDLNKIVKRMLSMLQRLIGEGILLSWQPAANLWQVKADPSQIDQILANLCVNARDAISGVGRITIETGNITLDKERCADHADFLPGEFVRISMSDDGCGMDKEILAKIFEPFFTTKGVGMGTGLGLSSVFGSVKQNNGFIDVISEPGSGTTFTIYLPRHVGKVEQTLTESETKPDLRGHETILLVEDQPDILQITRVMLEAQGYAILAASLPGDAIRLASEHPGEIHLLITDVIMPGMDGWALATKLSSLYPQLKRLFMSGYTADIIAHHGVLQEGESFIEKPFSPKTLAAKVREVLDSRN